MRPALAALALLVTWPARADVTLVLYPGIGRPTQVTVTGRVVAGAPAKAPAKGPTRAAPKPAAGAKHAAPTDHAGSSSAAPPAVEPAEVSVTFGGQVRLASPGPDGLFEAVFATSAERPFPVGFATVQASRGSARSEGQVQVVDDGAPFLLVADLDELPGFSTRRPAPGDAEAPLPALGALFRCLLEGTRPASAALAVVGAPLAQLPRLQAALQAGGFPAVALQPHPAPDPGPAGPLSALRAVLSTFPQAVVLVGDAAGRAPERFAALRAQFPGRVAAVYLRGRDPGTGVRRFEGMTLFTEPARVAQLAASRGGADQACADRLVAGVTAPAAPPVEPAEARPQLPGATATCPPCPCPASPETAPPTR